jgi:hypothetical protein
MRKSQIRWEHNRLTIHEPIFNSTKTMRLIIVPKDLQRHIFTAFHATPLGGHFSVYYTLHRIRLRFHWPGMYTQIKRWIQCCAACVLRNSGSKVSSELLYSFPMLEPMQCIHANAWVPGKTTSFQGLVGLMVVICHLTEFVTIEPLSYMNSTTFARSVYRIMLRYGIAQMVITDPESKFKGEFREAFQTLKIQHHMSS